MPVLWESKTSSIGSRSASKISLERLPSTLPPRISSSRLSASKPSSKGAEIGPGIGLSGLVFFACSLKPALGFLAALVLGPRLLEPNDYGVLAIWPALTSAAALACAITIPGTTRLSRLWRWIAVLAASGFATRAIADAWTWTPPIWLLVVVPLYRLSRDGAWWRLLESDWARLRYGAQALLVAVVVATLSLFPPFGAGQVAAEHLIYPCVIVALGTMAHSLTRRPTP